MPGDGSRVHVPGTVSGFGPPPFKAPSLRVPPVGPPPSRAPLHLTPFFLGVGPRRQSSPAFRDATAPRWTTLRGTPSAGLPPLDCLSPERPLPDRPSASLGVILCEPRPTGRAGDSHNDPREPKRAIYVDHGVEPGTIPRADPSPESGKKNEIWGGRGEKKQRNFGPTLLGPHFFWFGHPPSSPTLLGPPFWAKPFLTLTLWWDWALRLRSPLSGSKRSRAVPGARCRVPGAPCRVRSAIIQYHLD